MPEEYLEKEVPVQNTSEKDNYQRYLELGGIINKKDYDSALERANDTTVDKTRISQVEVIKDFAKIESLNPLAVKLYEILHSDKRPKDANRHHEEMRDQKLFREVLKMLGDTDALDKMKAVYHTNRPMGTHCPLCGKIKPSEDCP